MMDERRLVRFGVLLLALVVSVLTFFSLYEGGLYDLGSLEVQSVGLAVMASFTVGIGIVTAFVAYAYETAASERERINDLTQLYSGLILIVSSVVIFVLYSFTGIEIDLLFLLYSVTALTGVFLSIRRYDRFLEEHVEG